MKLLSFETPLTPEAAVALELAIAQFSGRVTLIAEAQSPISIPRIVGWVTTRLRIDAETLTHAGPRPGRRDRHPNIRLARAAVAWGMRSLLVADVEAVGQWFGLTTGAGLLAFAERERGRNPGFRAMTDAMVEELLS